MFLRKRSHRVQLHAEGITDAGQFASAVQTQIPPLGADVRVADISDRPPAAEAIVQPPGFIEHLVAVQVRVDFRLGDCHCRAEADASK